jgi:hypothetical protein
MKVQSIADFGILEDKDVFEMVKGLGNHMVVADCVNVGVINRNMDRVLLVVPQSL